MIPKLHYITQGSTPTEQLEHIQKACSSGAALIRLATSGIALKKIQKLAQEARAITSHFQTRLIIEDDFKLTKTLKADGVFFTKNPMISAREHLYSWQTIGMRVTSLQEGEDALKNNIDYLILYPFRISDTEIHASKSLGLKGCSLINEGLETRVPLLVEGTIKLEDVSEILKTGVAGIAVSRAITEDFNAIKAFNELLGASSTLEQRHSFE